jgi:hypothetical protein
MLIHSDRFAAATLSTLALASPARAISTCSYQYDCFTSPANDTYALSICGNAAPIDDLRNAFVSNCNATALPTVDTDFWRTIRVWTPVFMYRKEHNANDSAFVDCLDVAHTLESKSDAPKHADVAVAAAAAMLGACVFAYYLV